MSDMSHKLGWPAAPEPLGTWLAATPGSREPAPPEAHALTSERSVAARPTQIIRLEGTVRYLGGTGRFEIVAATDGRFVREVHAPAGDRAWFDGERAQFVDWNGMPGPLELYTLHWLQLGVAVQTGQWGAEEGPLRVVHPVSISNLLLAEMDLAFIEPYFGVPLAGLLGYDLFSRAVVEVEVAADRVALFDPERFDADLEWLPLAIHGQHPVVHARFDRGEGRFRLDLGAAGGPGGNVLFTAPAVERLELLTGRELQRAQAGVGEVAVGAIDWFELAGHRFEQPVAIFHLDESGPGGDPYLIGNIGVSFMEPFRIVFDYPRRRVAMVAR